MIRTSLWLRIVDVWLGLFDQLVGATHECDFPLGVEQLPEGTQKKIPHDAASGEINRLVREGLKIAKVLYWLKMETLESLKPEENKIKRDLKEVGGVRICRKN